MDDRRGLAGRVWVFRRGMAHRWICLGEFFPTSYIKCPGVNSRTSPLALDRIDGPRMDERGGLAGRVCVFRRGMAHRWICLGEFFPTSYIKCPGVNSRTSPLALDRIDGPRMD